MPIPISLLLDDPCPLVHVYRYHRVDVNHREPLTEDGRPLLDTIPNDFLDRFCDVIESRGIRGKFSIVPAPAGRGDIVRGIEGHDPASTREWVDTLNRRLSSCLDFCSEGITHNLAANLREGGYFTESENDWSQTQTRETLTPYLVRQLELLRDAGINATGVTSPWVFGLEVEPEYVAAIVAAQKQVFGHDFSWYFLHALRDKPNMQPWVAYQEGDTTLVHIPATTGDSYWRTIDSPRTDREWIDQIASSQLSGDGKSGQIRQVLDTGGWPILVTHWQSLFSNGLETGLAALDEVARRVNALLEGEVEWLTSMEMAHRVAGKG